jgi:hypothetical protein
MINRPIRLPSIVLLAVGIIFSSFPLQAQDGSSDVRFRSVPNVVGATERQAIELLTGSGLDPSISNQRLLSHEDIGTVARQTPRGGDRVAVGTRVEVFMSSGTAMPDLRGTNGDAARELLNQIPFQRVDFSETSSLQPSGSVVFQFPQAGDLFSPSVTNGRIGLSTGTVSVPADFVAVEPRSAGEFAPTIETVRNRLARLGFTGSIAVHGCSRSRPGDIMMCEAANQHCVVVGIDPPPGSALTATQPISLTTEIRYEGIAHLLGDEPCVPPR